jgi:hypothetical protein
MDGQSVLLKCKWVVPDFRPFSGSSPDVAGVCGNKLHFPMRPRGPPRVAPRETKAANQMRKAALRRGTCVVPRAAYLSSGDGTQSAIVAAAPKNNRGLFSL